MNYIAFLKGFYWPKLSNDRFWLDSSKKITELIKNPIFDPLKARKLIFEDCKVIFGTNLI